MTIWTSPRAAPERRRLVVVPPSRLSRATPIPGGPRVAVSLCGYTERSRTLELARNDPDELIVSLCVQGRGWCILDGRRYEVGAGEVMLLPPGRPHAYGADRDDPWTIWWLHLAVEDLEDLYAGWPPVSAVPDPFRLSGLIAEVVRDLEEDITDASLLVAAGAAWHVLSYLAAAPRLPHATASPLDRARDYIRDHVASPISVAELAALANLSASHFAAQFRRRFGISVLRYQTELRMARARQLLDATDLPVAAVAEQVGYPDPYYFSRQFTAIHHVTPRVYRRQSKG
jgi:AraC-like DNA-binding protein/quercetin dioxygenase-like cupin family protein